MPRLKIDNDYLGARLAELLAIPSPPGYTDKVVRACSAELGRLGVKFELTRRGAIRAIYPGAQTQAARAIVSHLDTIGAQVKYVKDNGRLELLPSGHWSARFAEGARATVFTDKGGYRGTIMPLKASGHTFHQEVDTQPVGWEYVELRIDALARSSREVDRLGIEIGDIVAIDPQPEFLDNGFIISRHLDNKGGVAVMLAAIEAMRRDNLETPVDIHWLFTIEEETGIGASSILSHDVAAMVAVDNGTTAPGQNSSEFGVTVAMADTTGPFDYHLTHHLLALCKEFGVPHQRDVFRYYRSDSAAAVEAGNDIRAALITFGIDASHGYERIHVDALVALAQLLVVYAQNRPVAARDRFDLGPPEGLPLQHP